MSKTATLKGKIAFDDTEFHKALRRATDRAKKFGSDVASAVGSATKKSLVGLGVAGAGAAVGLLSAAKAAADLGGQLSDASAITGVSADKMLVLQQAFKDAGMSGESAAGVIAKLQAAIGRAGLMSDETEDEVAQLNDRLSELQELQKNGLNSKEQARVNKEIERTQKKIAELETDTKGVQKAFQLLNLNRLALSNMDGARQLEKVFEAIGKLGNQSDKMAALRMLRLPPELMVLAKDPNAFKNAREMLGGLVTDMGQFSGKFDEVSDVMGSKFGILFKQIGSGFLKSIIDNPVLEKLLEKFKTLDLGFIGEEIGTRVSAMVNFISATIKEGKIKETLQGALEVGFAYAMKYFINGMGITLAVIGGVMESIFSDHGLTFITSFGAALTGALMVAAFNLGNFLISAWSRFEDKIAGSPLGNIMSGVSAVGNSVLTATGAVATGAVKAVDGVMQAGSYNLVTGEMDEPLLEPLAGALWSMTKNRYEATGANVKNLWDGPDSQMTDTIQDQVANSNALVAQMTQRIAELKAQQSSSKLKPEDQVRVGNEIERLQQQIQAFDTFEMFGMKQSELLGESAAQATKGLTALADALAEAPGRIKNAYENLEVDKITQPAADNAQNKLDAFIQNMSPGQKESWNNIINPTKKTPAPTGPMSYDEFLQRTYIGPKGIIYPGAGGAPNGRPDLSQRSDNRSQSGDKETISILEKVASLLERNLAGLQVA